MLALTSLLSVVACQHRPDPLIYNATSLLGSGLWGWGIYICLHRQREEPSPLWLSAVVGGGAALGAVWMVLPPLWENDFYRYSWDGQVLLHGINPYQYAPEAPQLQALRRPADALIAYPWVPTCYPPVAQLYFALSEGLARLTGWNPLSVLRLLAWLLTSAVSGWILVLCRAARINGGRVWIWACCPLLFKELSNSAHYDVACVFCVCWALWARLRGRDRTFAVALGLAVNLKTYPLLLVPFMVRGLPRRQGIRALLWFAGTIVLFYLPFAGVGWRMWEGLSILARYWDFNAPIMVLLAWAGEGARWLAGLLLGLLLLGRWIWTRRTPMPDEPAALAQRLAGDCIFAIGSLYLLSPVLDPWYLSWILPFLVLRPVPAWLVLIALSSNSYLFYRDNSQSTGQLLLEYIPPLLVWLSSAIASKRWGPASSRSKDAA